MKTVGRLFLVGYSCIALLFFLCALAVLAFAASELWHGINPGEATELQARFSSVLGAVGMLTIAVAALELGQTVLEEEVQRDSQLSAPTRVRRFVSRFLLVVVVALSVETLVTVFQLAHHDPSKLPQAATVGVAAAALLVAWGIFVKLNIGAEELEPEGIEKAKREDEKIDKD